MGPIDLGHMNRFISTLKRHNIRQGGGYYASDSQRCYIFNIRRNIDNHGFSLSRSIVPFVGNICGSLHYHGVSSVDGKFACDMDLLGWPSEHAAASVRRNGGSSHQYSFAPAQPHGWKASPGVLTAQSVSRFSSEHRTGLSDWLLGRFFLCASAAPIFFTLCGLALFFYAPRYLS